MNLEIWSIKNQKKCNNLKKLSKEKGENIKNDKPIYQFGYYSKSYFMDNLWNVNIKKKKQKKYRKKIKMLYLCRNIYLNHICQVRNNSKYSNNLHMHFKSAV